MTAVFLLVHSNLAKGIPEGELRAVEADGDGNAEPVSIGGSLRGKLATMPDSDAATSALSPVIVEVDDVVVPAYGSREIGVLGMPQSLPWDGPFVAAVNDPHAGELLGLLLGALDPKEWRAMYGLAIVYGTAASRRPIGADLN
ncbi:hypothetical protein QE375_003582 [Microbacterium foliorum]|uniref:Uncharacterized protein n=1 Tax=Microbacterium foliorum TaxID=104336 RepID=A0ABU1HVE9_9MICO|nr:hypothetical protein [Microbacterium foliorum]MDR6144028.1 hypothetical protein [Microbacterium foliorum]